MVYCTVLTEDEQFFPLKTQHHFEKYNERRSIMIMIINYDNQRIDRSFYMAENL